MIYVKLNDGRTQNLIHISMISLDKNTIVYQSAKGSLNNYLETFDNNEAATTRYEELKSSLLN